jgi:hypothetical protein
MRAPVFVCLFTLACGLSADTLTRKDGTTVQGTFLGGDSRQIRMLVGDSARSYAIEDVSMIKFGSDAPASQPAPPANSSASNSAVPAPAPANSGRALRPAGSDAPASVPNVAGLKIPDGSILTVRMIDPVDSQTDKVGQTYRASIDDPVNVDGRTAIPRGSDVVVKLVDDKESGKLSGRTELMLDLVSVAINGMPVEIDTQTVTQASSSRTGRTAKVVGGTAALGTVLGAIAGGGRGAAIGALSGAAAGGAVQVVTKGQRVKIPTETRLSFTLQQSIQL